MVCVLYEYSMGIVRVLYGYYNEFRMSSVWVLYGNCMGSVCVLYGYCMGLVMSIV